MDTKNQMLVDLDVIDDLIIRLTNLKEFYELELIHSTRDLGMEDYLNYAQEYYITSNMLFDLHQNKSSHLLKECRKQKQNI
jgi:hypothetical protein